MKLLAALAATAVCMASTVSAQVPDCDVPTLLAVRNGPSGATCQAQTQFTPTPGTFLTGEKLLKLCNNSNCMKLLAELKAALPTECLFSGIPIKSGIIDKYLADCKVALGETTSSTTTETETATQTPTNSGNGTSSNSTTNGDATVTAGPVASTPKPTSGGTVTAAASVCAVVTTGLALLI